MKKHILSRQNGNAIQYVQVTRTGGTKITTDPQKATLFDSVASAERQKNHAPKKLIEYQIYESGILHEEISSDKKNSQSYSSREFSPAEWIMMKIFL